MVRSVTFRKSATFPMVMMALSAVLDGMVLAIWVVVNASIVQNFQSALERLKNCAAVQAHPVSPCRFICARENPLSETLLSPCCRKAAIDSK